MAMQHLWLGFLLTILAGLSTGIGSIITFFVRPNNRAFLAVVLGFSGGVMIYVAFVELLTTAREILIASSGESVGAWLTVASFFAGVIISAVVDLLVPDFENPHVAAEDMSANVAKARLHRMGLLTAITIGLHNFPEGFATLMATQADVAVGVAVAVAIAMHNIPEGIAVSVPIFFATGNRLRAFMFSFLSGLAEPMGALVGYLILRPFMSNVLMGVVLAGVSGIMVFISLDQLIPNSKKYGKSHHSVYGLVGGMAVMALSLLLS